MTYKVRKHIWPVSLVMSIAIVGTLAAFLVLAANPGAANAHGPGDHPNQNWPACADMTEAQRGIHNGIHAQLGAHGTMEPCPSAEPNQAPVLSGTSLADVSLRYPERSQPIDVSVAFSDPDGDTLTYTAVSSNTGVATVSISGNMMTVISGTTRGTAVIRVTANDGKGGNASATLSVTVAEDYTLTADPERDPMLPAPPTPTTAEPEPKDPYADLRGMSASEIYVVEKIGGYNAKFHLQVGGSTDDVTVTITASEPEDGGITITDSDGLIGASFTRETDLEGSLTVKATDNGSRAFEIEGACEQVGAFAIITVDDKDLIEVAKGAIYCKEPVIVVPPDQVTGKDCYSVTGHVDQMRDDRDHPDATMKGQYDAAKYVRNSSGNIVRRVTEVSRLELSPEPVANGAGSTLYKTRFNGKALYTVAADGAVRHHLNNNQIVYEVKDGETLYYVRQGNKVNKVEYQVQGGRYVTPTPETGQDTVEVLVGSSSVQLTVTANAGVGCMADHVWIRFLDMAGNVIGTDVDECPTCRGAAGLDVQGLSSGQKLPLHQQSEAMNSAMALMYDQYDVLNPGGLTPPYLAGDADLYAQGKFRVQNPCGTANDGFYVEVFEQKDINRQELQNGWHREMIDCVPPLQPGANELKVSFDTADITAANTGTAVVTWEAIDNATEYTVAVINTTNPARYTIHGTPALVTVTAGDPETGRTARFPGIRSGTRYIFAVYARVTGGTYSALRFVILTPEFAAN